MLQENKANIWVWGYHNLVVNICVDRSGFDPFPDLNLFKEGLSEVSCNVFIKTYISAQQTPTGLTLQPPAV